MGHRLHPFRPVCVDRRSVFVGLLGPFVDGGVMVAEDGLGGSAPASVVGSGRERAGVVDQPERYPYQPALDGVRAVAVAGVVLFHFGWLAAGGGFLGVDVFLALSGFLITTLLLREFVGSGRVGVGAFYGRRARRLLPAVFLVLAVVALYGQFFADQTQLVKLRDDTLASLLYVANWRFIFSGASYFDQFSAPSPVSHLWSLAIEEQWYLVWPLVVIGLLGWLGPPVARARRMWLGITLGLAAASMLLMAVLVDDTNVNRVYYGTDTRAQTLLIGAALAMAFHGRSFSEEVQRRWDLVGLAGLAGCVAMFGLVDSADLWMYRGGLGLMAVFSVLMIGGAAGPARGWTKTVLSLPPLPELGRISYGVYLWHWPVLVFLDENRTGFSGASLFIVRVAVTLLIAIASFELVELPIRQRRWPVREAVIASVAALAAVAVLTLAIIPVQPNPDQHLAAAQTASRLAESGRGSPERLLVVGDSVGLTLAEGYKQGIIGRPAEMRAGTLLGCGVPIPDAARCRDVFGLWQRSINEVDPDTTVAVLGIWELHDRTIEGRKYPVGSARYAHHLLDQLNTGLRILTSRGGRVALLSVPCLSTQPGRSEPPPKSNDIAWINRVFAEAAARAGSAVKFIDYGGYICPDGHDQRKIDGTQMRPDGVHLTPEGAQKVWRWLGPQLPARSR